MTKGHGNTGRALDLHLKTHVEQIGDPARLESREAIKHILSEAATMVTLLKFAMLHVDHSSTEDLIKNNCLRELLLGICYADLCRLAEIKQEDIFAALIKIARAPAGKGATSQKLKELREEGKIDIKEIQKVNLVLGISKNR